jgi:hypothetical protein
VSKLSVLGCEVYWVQLSKIEYKCNILAGVLQIGKLKEYFQWNLTRYVTVNTCRHLLRLLGPEVHSLKDKGLGTNLQMVTQLSTWPYVDARVQRKRGSGQLVAMFAHPHRGDFYLSIRRVGGGDSQLFSGPWTGINAIRLKVDRVLSMCRLTRFVSPRAA